MQTAPYVMARNKSTDGKPLVGTEQYEGYCVDLSKMVARIVGFDYRIEAVKDGRYGGETKNGSWDGMIGELIRQVRTRPRPTPHSHHFTLYTLFL